MPIPSAAAASLPPGRPPEKERFRRLQRRNSHTTCGCLWRMQSYGGRMGRSGAQAGADGYTTANGRNLLEASYSA